jgi:hypothetical protein
MSERHRPTSVPPSPDGHRPPGGVGALADAASPQACRSTVVLLLRAVGRHALNLTNLTSQPRRVPGEREASLQLYSTSRRRVRAEPRDRHA